MAYSLDEGKTFHKYGKILIENPGIRDFRDPKVLRVGGRLGPWRWRSKTAAGSTGPRNLLDWEKTGVFGPLPEEEAPKGAVWECPDLYALPSQDGRLRWVLTISMQNPYGTGRCAHPVLVGRICKRYVYSL